MTVSRRTKADLEAAERRRLIEEAGRARKAREAREVAEGLGETVALGEARGEAFTVPKVPGAAPTRRMTGIDALVRAGKLQGESLVVAMAYGNAWRTAQGEARIRSCLGDTRPGLAPTLEQIGAAARRRVLAGYRLADMRAALRLQSSLIEACDRVLGMELTPREAGGNAVGSAVYTSLVLVAVDLMVAAQTPPTPTPAAVAA